MSSRAAKSAAPISHASAEANCRSRTGAACYAPQQFRVAYGIRPLLDGGTNGSGETVVLQEFARKPGPDRSSPVPVTDIRQDLALFDAVFGLPAARRYGGQFLG